MAGIDIHSCPRCELRFTTILELADHLERDHGAVPDAAVAAPPPPPAGTLTVAVDPGRPVGAIVDVAAAVARQGSMAVEIVAAALPGLPAGTTDAYLRARRAEAVAAGAPAARWVDLGSGPPAAAVLDHVRSGETTLLCMGTRARGPVGEVVLGSVSERVLRRSPVPVLLVGPGVDAATDYRRLLVALDGSTLAEAALGAAVSLGRTIGASLFLLEVLDPGVDAGDVFETAFLRRTARSLAGVVDYDTIHNAKPARAIVEMAEGVGNGATIVVMGTHGRSGLERVTMGSVALDVVRHAPCPVLVVPPTATATASLTRHAELKA